MKHKDKRNPADWNGMKFAIPFDYSMHRTAAAPTRTAIRSITLCANHILDFLVSRSRSFAAETPDHDPARVPLVRIGRTEPSILPAPKAVDTTSTQAIAR